MKALFCTINVKDWEDGNSADLNKLKKYIVANFAINATKLFKSTHGLLKSAVSDLDISFKRENLQLVSQNLFELNAVKNTVEKRLTSWASVVKKAVPRKSQ